MNDDLNNQILNANGQQLLLLAIFGSCDEQDAVDAELDRRARKRPKSVGHTPAPRSLRDGPICCLNTDHDALPQSPREGLEGTIDWAWSPSWN